MQHKTGLLAMSLGAAALLVFAIALAPTMIGAQDAGSTTMTGGSRSWVSDAFPTGQASFARGSDKGI